MVSTGSLRCELRCGEVRSARRLTSSCSWRGCFQKEGHCSYEAGKSHQTFDTRELASGHAAADGQIRYAACLT